MQNDKVTDKEESGKATPCNQSELIEPLGDAISWDITDDGRRTACTTGNKVNLCRYCSDDFPECPGLDIVFGDGAGSDNVCSCASYRYATAPRW